MGKGENLYSKLKKEGQIYQCVIIVTIIATDVAAATVYLLYSSDVTDPVVAGAAVTGAAVTGAETVETVATVADAEISSITAGMFRTIATKLPVAGASTHIMPANTVCATDAVATPIHREGRLAAVKVATDATVAIATINLKTGYPSGYP